jgi:hypothetical protein
MVPAAAAAAAPPMAVPWLREAGLLRARGDLARRR